MEGEAEGVADSDDDTVFMDSDEQKTLFRPASGATMNHLKAPTPAVKR